MSRKPETISFWTGRLPHWEVVDGRYFVTIHLAGAIPVQGQNRIRVLAAELDRIPRDQIDNRRNQQRLIFSQLEDWLDRAEHVSHLQVPKVAKVVTEAIAHRQGQQWNMLQYVVMPSHIHLFFELVGGGLKHVLEQFKRWTGHEAGKLLKLDGDRFWQDEWFDHWSRSDEEDLRIIEYIRRNPEKAKLVLNYLTWPYGTWSQK